MTELVKYEAARQALAEAVAVDEVLAVHDRAEALRHYARIAGDKTQEIQWAQLRFRAERRFGEMMAAQHADGKVARGGRPREKTPNDSSGVSAAEEPAAPREITLRDLGVDYRFSSRAQRVAAMDAAEFEQALTKHAEEMKSGRGRVAMDLLKIDAEEKGRAHRRDLAQALSTTSISLPTGRRYPANYIDCPWERKGGIGNRAYENHYPTMSWPDILAFLRTARDTLLPDAWSFFWIPRAHLLALVEIETEVTIASTGEVTLAKVEMPLAWACAQALGMDSYSTCFVWTKTDDEHPDDAGLGLLAWDQDELLLLFKRGRGLPKPAGGEKFGSNHRERAREHSRKPDFYRHMIATMVGCDTSGEPLPVLEMFARVDAEHPLPPNWDACGNQAGTAPLAVGPPAPPSMAAILGLEPEASPWRSANEIRAEELAALDLLVGPGVGAPLGVMNVDEHLVIIDNSATGEPPEPMPSTETEFEQGAQANGGSPVADPDIEALAAAKHARKAYPAGHVVHMTNPVIDGAQMSVARCDCGAVFTQAWGNHYAAQDASIEAHWAEFDHLPEKTDGRGNPLPVVVGLDLASGPDVTAIWPEVCEFDGLRAISDFCFPNRATVVDVVAPDLVVRGLARGIGGTKDFMLTENGWLRFHQLKDEQRDAADEAAADGSQASPAAGHPAPPESCLQDGGTVPSAADDVCAEPAVPPAGGPGSNYGPLDLPLFLPRDSAPAERTRADVFREALSDDDHIEWQALSAISAKTAVDPQILRGLIGIGYVEPLGDEGLLALTHSGMKWLRSIEQHVERTERVQGRTLGIALESIAKQTDIEDLIQGAA